MLGGRAFSGLGACAGVRFLGLGADLGAGVGADVIMNRLSSCCLNIFS